MDILDIGCGFKKYEGREGIDNVVTLDVNPNCKPDHVLEIRRGVEFPFEDSSFDLIIMSHVIEHLDDIVWGMKETHRIGKPGAEVRLWTPHYTSRASYKDPTHRWHLSLDFIYFFDKTSKHYGSVYANSADFRVIKAEPVFNNDKFGMIRKKLCSLVGKDAYEKYLSTTFLPLADMYFELKVVKD